MSAKFKFKAELFEEELVGYTAEQRELVAQYFAVIALTRKTGLLSAGVIRKELVYWQRFSIEIVMEGLRRHIKQYVGKPEQYTRGIIRTLEKGAEANRAISQGHHGKQAQADAGRGQYGQGDDRYIGADDPLPI